MDQQQIKLFASKATDHWQTPKEVLEYIKLEFGPFFDPCPRFPLVDGLTIEWQPVTYINPPYSKVKEFLLKAHEEIKKGNTHTLIGLTFANTETKWFKELVEPYADIRFLYGRLKFISDDGIKNSAMRPSILFIIRCKTCH